MTIRVISSTMGVSSPASIAEGTGYYRYRGRQPHREPPSEPLPQTARASEAKRRRVAEYARLRLAGVSKEAAAAGAGVSASTGRYYERDFQEQQRGDDRDA